MVNLLVTMFTLACAYSARGCRLQLSQVFFRAVQTRAVSASVRPAVQSEAAVEGWVVRPALVAVAPWFSFWYRIFSRHTPRQPAVEGWPQPAVHLLWLQLSTRGLQSSRCKAVDSVLNLRPTLWASSDAELFTAPVLPEAVARALARRDVTCSLSDPQNKCRVIRSAQRFRR